MERFKLTDLGSKKVTMAFDGSGWRIIESLEIKTSGVCPACGMDTAASPAAYYTVPRPKHKGKDAIALCTHARMEVEEARKVVSSQNFVPSSDNDLEPMMRLTAVPPSGNSR